MNTLLAPERSSSVLHPSMLAGRTPRPSAADRFAMRVALWLLMRSTHPVADDRELRRSRHELARLRTQRELSWERRHHLLPTF